MAGPPAPAALGVCVELPGEDGGHEGASTKADEIPQAVQLMSVDVRDGREGAIIRLHTDGPVESIRSFILRNPLRLVIDLPGFRIGKAIDVEGSGQHVDRVRLGENSKRVRVVIDAPNEQAIVHRRFEKLEDGLVVTLGREAGTRTQREPKQPEPREEATEATPPPAVDVPPSQPASEPADTEPEEASSGERSASRLEMAGPRAPVAEGEPALTEPVATPTRAYEPPESTAPSPEPVQVTPEEPHRFRGSDSTHLVSVELRDNDEGAFVRLRADGALVAREPFLLTNPDRLVIDLPGITLKHREQLRGSGTYVDRVRFGQHPGHVRVVIDAPSEAALENRKLVELDDGLLVTLGEGETVTRALEAERTWSVEEPDGAAWGTEPVPAPEATGAAEDVDLETADDGDAAVVETEQQLQEPGATPPVLASASAPGTTAGSAVSPATGGAALQAGAPESPALASSAEPGPGLDAVAEVEAEVPSSTQPEQAEVLEEAEVEGEPSAEPVEAEVTEEPQPAAETGAGEELPPVSAPPPQPMPELTGVFYEVGNFELGYLKEVSGAPSAEDLLSTEIALFEREEGYVGPRLGGRLVRFKLDSLPSEGPLRFHETAISAIDQQLVSELNRRGLGGVIVAPDDQDVDLRTNQDLRPKERTALRLTVFLPTIGEISTFARGDRISDLEEEGTNNPLHAKILESSPVQAGEAFRPREVEDYVARLNRHPSRHVSVQLSPSREPGRVYVDYEVNESKPWLLYAEYARNTGTKETTRNRTRAGLIHYQLTGRDDVLELDYLTGDFDEVTAARAAYSLPVQIGESRRLRVGVDGEYVDWEAEGAGFTVPSRFKGQHSRVGVEAVYNVFQHRELFVDLLAGINYWDIETENLSSPPKLRGKTGFMLPGAGVAFERVTQNSRLNGDFYFQSNVGQWANTKKDEMEFMGRLAPDLHFAFMRWDTSFSFFLEPLLNPAGYRDLSTHRSSARAHEIFFSYSGQDAFNYRLIPQFERIAGGLSTVRGYQQADLAGDNVHVMTAEYRFHLPRILRPRPPDDLPVLGEVALAPKQVGGRPDWDLMFRLFYDYARVRQNEKVAGEFDDNIRGVGFGLQFAYKQRLTTRFDMGWGLDDARGGQVSRGPEWYLTFTLFH